MCNSRECLEPDGRTAGMQREVYNKNGTEFKTYFFYYFINSQLLLLDWERLLLGHCQSNHPAKYYAKIHFDYISSYGQNMCQTLIP